MTPQLQSALDALNACRTAGDVADLLRRHEVRALAGADGERCDTCPIAAYFILVGGDTYAEVYLSSAWLGGEIVNLSDAVRNFIRFTDEGCYPDLEVAT